MILKTPLIRTKQWHIRAFSSTVLPTIDEVEPEVGLLFSIAGTTPIYTFNTDLESVEIQDSLIKTPLFKIKESITIDSKYIENLSSKGQHTDTIGRILFNEICLVYPFGDKIPYQQGQINTKALDTLVAESVVDDDVEDDTKIRISKFTTEYAQAVDFLSGLTQLFAPSATAKSVTVDPAVLKRRDELLEQYKDRLEDPTVEAKISKELQDLDKASFVDDPARDFFINDNKSFGVTRKQSFLFLGTQSGFEDGEKSRFIPHSLDEGWDYEYLPELVNSARAGSFNRGALTALGGEAVKYFYRIFQNTQITEDDCGTNHGINFTISDGNYEQFDGRWYFDSKRNTVQLTKETAKANVGNTLELRSALTCQTKDNNFCSKCLGKFMSMSPKGIHIAEADVGSIFMSVFMSKMHGSALRTVKYDLNRFIS